MLKFLKFGIGSILMLFRLRIFFPEKVFKGKKIAIIGPASSALDKMNGQYIDQFDLVIRINKAITTWNPKNEIYIGSKTDILVHSFVENQDNGGELDFKLFKTHNINYVLNPKNEYFNYRQIFNVYKKKLTTSKIYILTRKINREHLKDFRDLGYNPTNGFRALSMVLNSSPSQVYISGFTFFKTPYAKGYRDNLIDVKVNQKFIKGAGSHNPDLEFSLFLKLIESSPSKIILDDELQRIVKTNVTQISN